MATEKTTGRPLNSGAEHPLDCAVIRELLFSYMAHELGDGQTVLVREHLRHCESCAEEALRIQKTIELVRGNDPADFVSDGFSAKRRRRLLWLMEHPFVAKCLKHYRVTSLILMGIALVFIFFMMMLVKIQENKIEALPSVRLITVEPGHSELPPIGLPDPTPPIGPPEELLPSGTAGAGN